MGNVGGVQTTFFQGWGGVACPPNILWRRPCIYIYIHLDILQCASYLVEPSIIERQIFTKQGLIVTSLIPWMSAYTTSCVVLLHTSVFLLTLDSVRQVRSGQLRGYSWMLDFPVMWIKLITSFNRRHLWADCNCVKTCFCTTVTYFKHPVYTICILTLLWILCYLWGFSPFVVLSHWHHLDQHAVVYLRGSWKYAMIQHGFWGDAVF